MQASRESSPAGRAGWSEIRSSSALTSVSRVVRPLSASSQRLVKEQTLLEGVSRSSPLETGVNVSFGPWDISDET